MPCCFQICTLKLVFHKNKCTCGYKYYCGFLRYGKHNIEVFFLILFLVIIVIQPLFTCKYLLSFTGNALLIFYFELIFCFEAVFKNSYLISCYNISTLVTYLTIKHIYSVFHVSRITNGLKEIQHDQ